MKTLAMTQPRFFILRLTSFKEQLRRRFFPADEIHYINGPDSLPPPLSREEERLVFLKLEAKVRKLGIRLWYITCGLSFILQKI